MKNKKKKTTTEQFIDDLIASGIPLGNELKKYFQENKDKLKEVDEKFYSHIYPQIKLNWCKLYNNNLEITKKTDKASINILNILYKLINRNYFNLRKCKITRFLLNNYKIDKQRLHYHILR